MSSVESFICEQQEASPREESRADPSCRARVSPAASPYWCCRASSIPSSHPVANLPEEKSPRRAAAGKASHPLLIQPAPEIDRPGPLSPGLSSFYLPQVPARSGPTICVPAHTTAPSQSQRTEKGSNKYSQDKISCLRIVTGQTSRPPPPRLERERPYHDSRCVLPCSFGSRGGRDKREQTTRPMLCCG